MAKASLNVTIPPGMKAGQEIQAVSPDGTVVQATIPKGMKPGQTFQVQYTPVAPSAPSSGNGSGFGAGTRLCEMYSGGDLMILAALVVVGFALPVLLKNGGGLLNFLSTYVVPIVCAGLAIAYASWCAWNRNRNHASRWSHKS
ncbi:unnamed protein product [Effrenium voratum]|nr:unnamed protein product [Effrenium voratum]